MLTLLFLCALPLQVRGDVRAATLSVAGGTSLLDVLRRTGWEPGASGKGTDPKVKHVGLRYVLVFSSDDGYQAVFSAGEVFRANNFTFAETDGVLRLLVPDDKARGIHAIKTLDVVDARKWVR